MGENDRSRCTELLCANPLGASFLILGVQTYRLQTRDVLLIVPMGVHFLKFGYFANLLIGEMVFMGLQCKPIIEDFLVLWVSGTRLCKPNSIYFK